MSVHCRHLMSAASPGKPKQPRAGKEYTLKTDKSSTKESTNIVGTEREIQFGWKYRWVAGLPSLWRWQLISAPLFPPQILLLIRFASSKLCPHKAFWGFKNWELGNEKFAKYLILLPFLPTGQLQQIHKTIKQIHLTNSFYPGNVPGQDPIDLQSKETCGRMSNSIKSEMEREWWSAVHWNGIEMGKAGGCSSGASRTHTTSQHSSLLPSPRSEMFYYNISHQIM